MIKLFLLASVLACLSVDLAQAKTVILDAMGELGEIVLDNDEILTVEDGFSFLACDYHYCAPGGDVITIGTRTGDRKSELSSVSGKRFDLISADLSTFVRYWRTGFGDRLYNTESDGQPCGSSCDYWQWAFYESLTFESLGVLGYRNGKLVADAYFSDGAQDFEFDKAFRNLDSVQFVARVPDAQTGYWPPSEERTEYCYVASGNLSCSRISIDEIILRPVPLPAALPLSLAGLGLLVLAGKRRKKAAA
ncbi:hypothetical protein [Thetidibacter halocola]|uniref:VPLPA-CTERM sorting domain-containing protein n=1 Tax=Thetidibacter halocola TaxID=2827239 RepID=A0A8J7WB94_9RHOB|nr:hypothetical protein [Thetidibacter halocola]MBS0122526.1 hypothetical protein [Thetidibacter halocola]